MTLRTAATLSLSSTGLRDHTQSVTIEEGDQDRGGYQVP